MFQIQIKVRLDRGFLATNIFDDGERGHQLGTCMRGQDGILRRPKQDGERSVWPIALERGDVFRHGRHKRIKMAADNLCPLRREIG